jgi:hypothetical protein
MPLLLDPESREEERTEEWKGRVSKKWKGAVAKRVD